MEKILAIIYLIGQIVDIVGAYLLFKFAWPEGFKKTNQAYLGGGSNILDQRIIKQERMSKIGFILLAVGFFLQIPTTLNSIFN